MRKNQHPQNEHIRPARKQKICQIILLATLLCGINRHLPIQQGGWVHGVSVVCGRPLDIKETGPSWAKRSHSYNLCFAGGRDKDHAFGSHGPWECFLHTRSESDVTGTVLCFVSCFYGYGTTRIKAHNRLWNLWKKAHYPGFGILSQLYI